MKANLLFLCSLLITLVSFSQTTYVPDDNFEQALIDLGYDTGALDDYVPTANINTVTSLNVVSKNISDLTGIEDFAALTSLNCNLNQLTSLDVTQNLNLDNLYCGENQLTSLDVTQNIALTQLNCSYNQITSLDVTQNIALTNLWCFVNQLTSLDVTQNTALIELYCYTNQLTNLDVTQNTALTDLDCGYNQLTNLDISQNIALTTLWCRNNQLTNLDVTQHTALTSLACGANQLTSLDVSQNIALVVLGCYENQLTNLDVSQNISLIHLSIGNNQLSNLDVTQNMSLELLFCFYNELTSLDVTQNTALRHLYTNNNQLTDLDLSQNAALELLWCYDNQLETLNVKNGNNTAIFSFDTNNNPNLTCIQVDDVAWSSSNWTNIDAQTSFSENCNDTLTYVPDDNFEQALIDFGYDTGALDDYVPTANIDTVTELYVSSRDISDLTGIEDFTALLILDCGNNQLTSLDVTQNIALQDLNIESNQITNLDVTQNTALWLLNCHSNQLTSLDVTQNTILSVFFCSMNLLTELDCTQNTNLITLDCENNLLESLNVKNGNNMAIPYYWFRANNNPNLTCIEVDDASYSSTTWINIDPQSYFRENCFSLLFDNFGIEVISETCPDKNNGQISITANETYDYETTFNGVDYNFTGNLLVTDLPPGNYEFCISVPAEDYTQCFTIEVIEGVTTSGRSSESAGRISITIDKGTAPFKVFVNNEIVLQTHSNTFDVSVGHGDFVEVKTDKDCEGTYAKTIGLVDKLIGYPNPTTGVFEIALPILMEEVTISLYSIQGQLISIASYPVKNGKVKLDITNNASGVYFAKVYLEKPVTIKILKR